MINVNDFKTGMTITYEGNLYQVLEFQHVKPGKGAAIVKTKLKNLKTGAIIEQSFNAGIKVEQGHVEKIKMQYLYESGGNYTFMNMNTYEQVELVCKEFQLLEYFMNNPTQILSKEQIYDKVWGIENEIESNNLEAYLSFIRRKIKAIDSEVIIKAARGLGYKME